MTSLFILLIVSYFLYPFFGAHFFPTYFAFFLIGQSFLWLLLFSRRDRIAPWLLVIGLSVASFTARSTPPLFENDYYRYLWDANQVFHTMRPYAASPDVANAFGLETVRERINYPFLATLYPPLIQLLFGAARVISGPGLDAFLWVLIASGTLCFAVGFFRFCRYEGIASPALTTCFVLQHPLLVKEWYQSCHYDVWIAAGLVWAFSLRGVARGVWIGIASNMKVMAFVALAWMERRNWRALVAMIVVLSLPWVFFLRDLENYFLSMKAFGSSWEMNSGPFRWLRETTTSFLPADWSGLACRSLAGLTWIGVTWRLFRSRLSESEQAFWSLFLMPWLSPVANPWYFTWSLPLAIALPPERRRPALALFIGLPAYYFFFAPGFPFLRLWDLEHIGILVGIVWILSRSFFNGWENRLVNCWKSRYGYERRSC